MLAHQGSSRRGYRARGSCGAQFGVGAMFYKLAYKALRNKSATMEVLIVIGTSAAYFYSVFAVGMDARNEWKVRQRLAAQNETNVTMPSHGAMPMGAVGTKDHSMTSGGAKPTTDDMMHNMTHDMPLYMPMGLMDSMALPGWPMPEYVLEALDSLKNATASWTFAPTAPRMADMPMHPESEMMPMPHFFETAAMLIAFVCLGKCAALAALPPWQR